MLVRLPKICSEPLINQRDWCTWEEGSMFSLFSEWDVVRLQHGLHTIFLTSLPRFSGKGIVRVRQCPRKRREETGASRRGASPWLSKSPPSPTVKLVRTTSKKLLGHTTQHWDTLRLLNGDISVSIRPFLMIYSSLESLDHGRCACINTQ